MQKKDAVPVGGGVAVALGATALGSVLFGFGWAVAIPAVLLGGGTYLVLKKLNEPSVRPTVVDVTGKGDYTTKRLKESQAALARLRVIALNIRDTKFKSDVNDVASVLQRILTAVGNNRNFIDHTGHLPPCIDRLKLSLEQWYTLTSTPGVSGDDATKSLATTKELFAKILPELKQLEKSLYENDLAALSIRNDTLKDMLGGSN